jgi:tagaturonate reductase
MNLSKQTLAGIKTPGINLPAAPYFELPEKVLQFGTGVLLRGLPDYFIDKANKQGIFNGRVVVVKSTGNGATDAFAEQDGLFTQCIQGIEDGKKVEEKILNASISRVLAAKSDWDEILRCAANPDMQIIISNTTEVGITLIKDNVHASPPESFPGKLLAFLYQRFKVFQGDGSKGMVIIPTELIPDNGKKLEAIVLELAHQNGLETAFLDWLETHNQFCNSLVDRIVPGKLPAVQHQQMEADNGYRDELMIMSEVYRLWAIESDNDRVRDILSFSKADAGVVIAPDINIFRELKLRLLNGSHTFSCGLAHLAGFLTVKAAMDDATFTAYIGTLMLQEMVPAVASENISIPAAKDFAFKVLDRYRNPYIEHLWLSITVQYSSKMKMRNIPLLLKHYERAGSIPEYMALGFAGHLLFMKSTQAGDGKYYGELNGKQYLVNDDHAAWYAAKWANTEAPALVQKVLSDTEFWGANLAKLSGFAEAVTNQLDAIIRKGAAAAMKSLQSDGVTA